MKLVITKEQQDILSEYINNLNEATTSASSGSYETSFFLTPSAAKARFFKKPIYKDGAFISVKDKCKKFPYCNQGDINALEITKTNRKLSIYESRHVKKENLMQHVKEIYSRLGIDVKFLLMYSGAIGVFLKRFVKLYNQESLGDITSEDIILFGFFLIGAFLVAAHDQKIKDFKTFKKILLATIKQILSTVGFIALIPSFNELMKFLTTEDSTMLKVFYTFLKSIGAFTISNFVSNFFNGEKKS